MTYRQLLSVNADFRRLWTGQVVSEIGDWLNNVAVLALTIQLAGPHTVARAIAVYALARHVPLFLFGPLAGVVVDRQDRRRVMIVADVARAILALGFLLATRLAALPVIYLVGASLFSVSSFFNAAKRAAIPNIVRGPEQLLTANALSASTTAATIAVGSALGGLVATFLSREIVFILNAATFLVSAEMIRRVKGETRRHASTLTRRHGDAETRRLDGRKHETLTAHDDARDETGIEARVETREETRVETRGESVARADESVAYSDEDVARDFAVSPRLRVSASSRRVSVSAPLRVAVSDFREGLRYVRGHVVLSAVFMVAAGWGLGNGVARALYSIFGARLGVAAVEGIVARPMDFGISVLFVAMGLGGVLGAPIARRFNAGSGASLGARMGRSMIFDGCGLVLFSFMPNLWGACAVLVAREINFAIWWTAQQTIIMSRTDDRYAGRVFASYETLTTLMMVGSMMASGLAADTYGIRPVAATGGAVIALSGLLWFALRGRRHQQREQAAGSI